MANIIVREYNPTTGAFVSNVSSISFGRIVAGTNSPVKVLDFTFTGVSVVSNVKLGLVSAGGINYSQFGLDTSSTFSSTKAAGPSPKVFSGLNNGTTSTLNTVSVPTRDDSTTNYIYLDVLLGANDLGSGSGLYKIFFEFS